MSAYEARVTGETFTQEADLLLNVQAACNLPERALPSPSKDAGREGCAKGGDGRPEPPLSCPSQGTWAAKAVPPDEHVSEAGQERPQNNDPPEDDMSVDDVEVTNVKERPKRHTCRPQFYQSDEMERMEKEKRKTT